MGVEKKSVLIGVIPASGKRNKPIRITAVFAEKEDKGALAYQTSVAHQLAKWGFFGQSNEKGD